MKNRFAPFAAALAAACSLAAAAPAAAQSEGGEARYSNGRVHMSLFIDRFDVVDGRAVALGKAAAVVRDTNGKKRTLRRSVQLAVASARSCRVLSLNLKDLRLDLLGLIINTSEVNLRITGEPKGGALGKLFCKLSRSLKLSKKVRAARVSRSLNRRLKRKPMRVLRFSAAIFPKQQAEQGQTQQDGSTARASQNQPPQNGSCEVLDLVLGPLNLDLLGLVVDLFGENRRNPVRVLVTADPNGGALGSLFCQLAQGQSGQQ